MNISVFDLFNIGIGPSSSHTVGPMRAARNFVERLAAAGHLIHTARVVTTLYGSLGATGKGHGSDKAVILGLLGETPEGVAVETIESRLRDIRRSDRLTLCNGPEIAFVEKEHLIFDRKNTLPFHPNGMKLEAFDAAGNSLSAETYFSTGGGFIVREGDAAASASGAAVPFPFDSGAELLAHCQAQDLGISELMLANEKVFRSEAQIRSGLARIWEVMQQCVATGCKSEGRLPGGLKIQRRAPELHRKLSSQAEQALRDPLTIMDWVNLYAMAVNEENAAGGRVVTAPTNGAAGIIPAVLHYATRFCTAPRPDSVERFLLTAGAIGLLYKKNASISGADVGCQGEVGVACSMAAGGLVEFLGGSPGQVENAAEIGMEHNLGLTCDPIGGLVQIPCIERNAMGSIKAINAARIALRGDGHHFVSLDKVIKTMRDTGRDMLTKYKETARGGLAVNVVEC
jgi:L-serine dehydratase